MCNGNPTAENFLRQTCVESKTSTLLEIVSKKIFTEVFYGKFLRKRFALNILNKNNREKPWVSFAFETLRTCLRNTFRNTLCMWLADWFLSKNLLFCDNRKDIQSNSKFSKAIFNEWYRTLFTGEFYIFRYIDSLLEFSSKMFHSKFLSFKTFCLRKLVIMQIWLQISLHSDWCPQSLF